MAKCRERCWERDWVIDLDVRKFFDSVPWDLMVKAVQANTTHEQRWIVLYVRRWLAAPIVMPDGRTQARDKGTPQGSAVSPVLADLFMPCAFESGWTGSSRASKFGRYADLCRARHKSAYAEDRIMPTRMSDALVRAVGGFLMSA